jgi:hypothetical protein
MSDLWGKNGGIYLGFEAQATEGQAPAMNSPLRYTRDRHIVTIGPNGSG